MHFALGRTAPCRSEDLEMSHTAICVRGIVTSVTMVLVALATSCGGAGGGAGPGGSGQGLVLTSFLQGGLDNVALNERLAFRFSEAVNPNTVAHASIQIRKGNAFGLTAEGEFVVAGSVVYFYPALPGLCSLADSGFQPDTTYRVQLMGNPEEFAIENTQGQPLNETLTFEFHTRDDLDPNKFIDQIAGVLPKMTSSVPASGADGVPVLDGNKVILNISENLDPCTVVNNTSVFIEIYETGDPAGAVIASSGQPSGFYHGASTADQTADHETWGADVFTTLPTPQTIPATVSLVQSFASTQIHITPVGSRFPENCLIVVRATLDIEDFGGSTLVPAAISFTTENLPAQYGLLYTMEFEGETPIDEAASTADVDTARSPGVVQGFMLFAGDGDNGTPGELLTPGLPETPASACTNPRHANDGTLDERTRCSTRGRRTPAPTRPTARRPSCGSSPPSISGAYARCASWA